MVKTSKEVAEARRRNVLVAARELFAEHGYEATSVMAMSRRAGCSSGGITHHFGSKADVFRTVLLGLEEEHLAHVRDAAAVTKTGIEGFVACCRAHLEFMTRPDYRRIALSDAVAVVGMAERRALEASLGPWPLESHIHQLLGNPDGIAVPTLALATLVSGALAHAAAVMADDDTLTSDDFIEAITGVLAATVGGSAR